MATYTRTFRCEILTPSGRVCSAQAVHVMFPGPDGMVGILAGRAPLVAAVGRGAIVMEFADGTRREFYAEGGFCHVREQAMTIMAEACLPVESIDPERAWSDIEDARGMRSGTPEECARRDRALEKARLKFALVQKHRRRTGKTPTETRPE